MEHNPEDLKMAFTTPEGVKIRIYDTYCKNFTLADKEIADAKFNDILFRSLERRELARMRESGASV